MPYRLVLPPELAGAVPELARDPRFRHMLRAGRRWRSPRVLLWIARRLGVELDARSAALAVVHAGFHGLDWPWHILRALVVLWRGRRSHVPMLAWTDDRPRHYGPPETALQSRYYPSFMGPAPDADTPSLPQARPTGPPATPPSRPRPMGLVRV